MRYGQFSSLKSCRNKKINVPLRRTTIKVAEMCSRNEPTAWGARPGMGQAEITPIEPEQVMLLREVQFP